MINDLQDTRRHFIFSGFWMAIFKYITDYLITNTRDERCVRGRGGKGVEEGVDVDLIYMTQRLLNC